MDHSPSVVTSEQNSSEQNFPNIEQIEHQTRHKTQRITHYEQFHGTPPSPNKR